MPNCRSHDNAFQGLLADISVRGFFDLHKEGIRVVHAVHDEIVAELQANEAEIKGLAKLCKEAGVQKVTPHELRHSCTEVWFSHGASLEDVRSLLGHKCPKTTGTYVHRTDNRLIKLAKEIRLQSVTF